MWLYQKLNTYGLVDSVSISHKINSQNLKVYITITQRMEINSHGIKPTHVVACESGANIQLNKINQNKYKCRWSKSFYITL